MEMVQSLRKDSLDVKEIQGINRQTFAQKMRAYKRQPLSLALLVLVVASAVVTIGIILFLISYILLNGVKNITPELFAWKYTTENVSMLPAMLNTLYMTGLTLLLAVPIGVFSAIYLVEYAKRGNKIVNVMRVTTETLQGIPSIVYGLFGYLMFCIGFDWGYTLLAGTITLAIMVLPVIMRTTEEALLSVPDSYREGSFGLGAGRLRTVFTIVLPSVMPGIIAGIILAIGRIVGETAALIFTAGTVATAATGLFDSTRTLAVHMYCLLSEGLYMNQAYATAVILLVMVLGINALSGYVAKKFTKN